MQSVRLSVEYTEETIHPMHAFVCESPRIEEQRLLEGRIDGETRTMLFHIVGDPAAYEEAMTARERIEEYRIQEDDDGGFFLYVRVPNDSAGKMLLEAVDRETVVVVPPVEYGTDMTVHITAVGHADELRAIVDDVPDELDVSILSVGPFDGIRGRSPTERQREALVAAWEAGYYDVPRSGGIDDVADELDCVPSTVSTLLRRAEQTIVAGVLGEEP